MKVLIPEEIHSWLVETIEYEIDYFEKLDGDRTEDETRQLEQFRKFHQALEPNDSNNSDSK